MLCCTAFKNPRRRGTHAKCCRMGHSGRKTSILAAASYYCSNKSANKLVLFT
jgi:hypothetical protein